MIKAKITVNAVVELNPTGHAPGVTAQEMLEAELSACRDEPLEYLGSQGELEVAGELILEAPKETQAEEHGPEEQGSGA